MAKDTLTGKMENFALSYVRQGVASQAYRDAYDCSKMKPESVNRMAHRIINIEKVRSRISQLQAEIKKDISYGIKEAMQDLVAFHTADINDIMQVRRLNCRHCNGVGFLYQWKDAREFAVATATALDTNAARQAMRPKRAPLTLPTDDGGYGFRRVVSPHPDCPECDGEGIEDTWIADTRKLKGAARKMYGGFKQLKDGRIEVLTRDRDAAFTNLMKSLGMFTDTVKVLPPGAAPEGLPALPEDPTEASRVYQEFIRKT